MADQTQLTKFWSRYKKGLEYIDSKNLVARSNMCWNFFIGKQWEGVESGDEKLPFFNFIHPNILRKVTTIYSNRMAVNYSDMDGRTQVDGIELTPIYNKLSEMFSAKWEKANMDVNMRLTLKGSAVVGDGVQYYGTANVEDVQLLDNTSVLYGDESEQRVQRQPYIMIPQRISVADVKAMARENGLSEDEIVLIVPDNDTDNLLGNREEVKEADSTESTKTTLITHFEKKKEPVTEMIEDENGNMVTVETGRMETVVYICKFTKTVIIEEEHAMRGTPSEVDANNGKQGRALRLYPLVKLPWENYPNDARGVSQVEGLIANQIEINKTIARRAMVTKLGAYPRPVYDESALVNPEALSSVGTPIIVASGGVSGVKQFIDYLEPAQTSHEPKQLTDDLLEITQELSGSGDTTMGNIDLQRVAASAVVAVNEKAESMHDEVKANLEMAVEDLANLWVELWQVYSPNGLQVVTKQQIQKPVLDAMGQPVIDPMTGQPQMTTEEQEATIEVSKEELDLIKPTTRIDVSKDNSWTREAMQTWLDGVLEKQLITLEEYIELCPTTSPVPVAGMKKIFDKRKMAQELQNQMAQQQAEQQNLMDDPEAYAMQAWEQQG